MADFGYDVSNYTDVEPLFGTLDDFDEMLSQAHKKGLLSEIPSSKFLLWSR